MNSKTLERIVCFRTQKSLDVIKEVISWKIFYQFCIVKKPRNESKDFEERLNAVTRIDDIFLLEALAARQYWISYKKIIHEKYKWDGRCPKKHDPVNDLLDIGYHYLMGIVSRIFEEIELPYELGFLHKAQSRKAKPLVYDFVEWLRPIIVDKSVLIYLRKKKLRIEKLTPRDIGLFVNLLKRQLIRLYYHKGLGYCITLEYWIRLNCLSLLHGINHNTYPSWNFPSLRHETRCKKNPPTTSVVENLESKETSN